MDWPKKKIIDDEYVQISILSFLHYIASFFFEYLTVGLLEFLFVPKLKLTSLSTGICHTFFCGGICLFSGVGLFFLI